MNGQTSKPHERGYSSTFKTRVINGWQYSSKWVVHNGRFIAKLVATIVGLLLFTLNVRGTLFAPTSIGSPSSESDALIRTNERMLEMAKWTISTILVVGGALIGLNWYSNEHRYRADKTQSDEQLKTQRKSFNKRIARLEATHLAERETLLDIQMDVWKLTSQITNTMLFHDDVQSSGGYVASVIRLLNRIDASEIVRQNALESVIVMFERPDAAHSFSTYLGADHLPELVEIAEKLGHQEEAVKIQELYERYTGVGEEKSKGSE